MGWVGAWDVPARDEGITVEATAKRARMNVRSMAIPPIVSHDMDLATVPEKRNEESRQTSRETVDEGAGLSVYGLENLSYVPMIGTHF